MATVDSLIIEIDASAESVGKKLDSFSSSLSRVAQECETVINRLKATKGTIQYEMAQLQAFQAKGTGVPWIDKLKKQCEELSKMRLSSSWGNQMQRIRQEIEASKAIDTSGLQHIVDSFKPLTDIPKASGLNSAVNTLRKIPDMIEQMNGISSEKLDTFQQQIKDITGSISPLTAELATLADSYRALPPPVQEAINANKRLAASNESTAKSSHSLLDSTIRLGAVLYGLRRVGDFAFGTFTKSNDFVEGLNLASITLGDNLRAARRYAETVENLVGINQTDWLSNQGTFAQMLTGFGFDQRKAAQMSQQLVQLGYDFQSAFNASDVTQVMDRLQSGLAGQIKGMREYGVELSVAAMQEYALSKGITTSWTEMSQAQKVALRYSKIMESTKNIQGDLARTLITPANSLRMLSSQWGVAQRYMGQFVSVIAAQVIPIVQTMVAVIASAARALASLWGYALPSIPAISGASGAFGDMAD